MSKTKAELYSTAWHKETKQFVSLELIDSIELIEGDFIHLWWCHGREGMFQACENDLERFVL